MKQVVNKLVIKQIKSISDLKKLSKDELEILAKEIRAKLIEIASKQKIHLGSNLGIVELTIALLIELDHDRTKIFYDTGHQCYVHKILTNRYDLIDTIRQENGLSGFPSELESKYDFVSCGHSSTSLSICQGFNESSNDVKVIPVIGDAALNNGLAFEALNDIAFRKTNMVIIVNDNEESISKSVGFLYEAMAKINKENNSHYNKNIFQSLGFDYVGPIDGHDIGSIRKAYQKANQLSQNGPTILHVKTIKSKGYKKDSHNNHSLLIGEQINNSNASVIAANHLENYLAKKNEIYIINSAMTIAGGYQSIEDKYSQFYQDVGINEEHAVTKASGIALNNKKVIVPMYSTFLQRSYDQIHHDVARLQLPVVFLIDRADLACQDGDTHHGIYDVGMIKSIPNTILASPSNKNELVQLIDMAIENKKNPFFIRFANQEFLENKDHQPFNFGDWVKVNDINSDIVIISYGYMINSIQAKFKNEADIVNAIFLNQFDENKIFEMLKKYKKIICYERIYNSGTIYKDLLEIFSKNDFRTSHIISLCYQKMNIGHGDLLTIDKRGKMSFDEINKLLE